jgi:hypothetical protein
MHSLRTKASLLLVMILIFAVIAAGCSGGDTLANPSKVVRGVEIVDYTGGELYSGFVAPQKVDGGIAQLLTGFPADEIPVPGGLYNDHQSFAGAEGLRFDYGVCMFHHLDTFRDDEEDPNDFGVNISTDAPSDQALAEWYRDELEDRGWSIVKFVVDEQMAESRIRAEKGEQVIKVLIYEGGNGPGYTRTDDIAEEWDFIVFAMLVDLD